MAETNSISADVNDAWEKLNIKWKGEDADAFYKLYITKIHETAESFEKACADMGNISSDLMKELQSFQSTVG